MWMHLGIITHTHKSGMFAAQIRVQQRTAEASEKKNNTLLYFWGLEVIAYYSMGGVGGGGEGGSDAEKKNHQVSINAK